MLFYYCEAESSRALKKSFLGVILNDSEESRWLNPGITALKEILHRLQLLRMTLMIHFSS